MLLSHVTKQMHDKYVADDDQSSDCSASSMVYLGAVSLQDVVFHTSIPI